MSHSRTRTGSLLAGLLLLLLLAAGLAPAAQVAATPAAAPEAPVDLWWTEVVDTSRHFSLMTARSLAYDSAGHPHIAYGEDHLYHAWFNSTNWNIETVDPAPQVRAACTAACTTRGSRARPR